MDAKIDAILHYIGDWIDDNYGERVEDCAEDLTEMIKKIGEVRTMDGKAVKEIQAKMKTWTDAGIELAYNSGYEQGCKDRDEIYAEDKEDYNRGLNDAWECAKKLCQSEKYGGLEEHCAEIFNRQDTFDVFDYSASEAITKITEYEEGGSDASRNNQ